MNIIKISLIIAALIFFSMNYLDGKKEMTSQANITDQTVVSPHANMIPDPDPLTDLFTAKTAEAVDLPASFKVSKSQFVCVNGKPRVVLQWASFKPQSTYNVQRRAAGKVWMQSSKRLPSFTTSFNDDSAQVSTTYQYRVKAMGIDGIGFSDTVSVSVGTCSATPTPPPPSGGTTPPPPVVTPPPAPTPTPPPPVITPPPQVTPPPAQTSKISWGAFNGWRVEDGPAFEAQVGKKMKSRAVFVHWGNENAFPLDVANSLKAQGATLIIFWEAMDYTGHLTDQPRFSYNSIIRGDHDAYVKSFAASVKAYGGPVIMIPFSEMNGNWNPSSGVKNGNTPEQHKKAFQHLKNLFAGVTNAKFGWAVNQVSVPDTAGNQIEDYYPGDAYVDYVGVDGFNFANPWMSFSQVFDTPLAKLKKYNKPIYIFSVASCQGSQKAAWINDAFKTQLPKHPEVKGFVWFNQSKECDWRVWSDAQSLEAFKSVIN